MSDESPDPAIHLSVDPAADPPAAEAGAESCLQLLVVGDFSGREAGAATEGPEPVRREPLRVEWIDDALSRFRPTVRVGSGNGSYPVTFSSLEDFHPDRLIARVGPLLAVLTGADEPSEEGSARTASAPPAPDAEHGREAPAGLLDDVVEATEQRRGEATGPIGDLQEWVRDVVGAHLEQEPSGSDAARREGREAAAAAAVRAVLHDPAVRALEAVWRGLFALLREVDGLGATRIHVLDLARTELDEALTAGELEDSWLLRSLGRPLPGPGGRGHPLGLIVAAYDFGPEVRDILVLNRLALLGHTLGAPVLTGAAPALLGLASFADDPGETPSGTSPLWETFRETPASASLALFAPRFLGREPYGPDADPCDTVDLDEVPEGATGPYVWCNGAFLGAALIARHHERAGGRADLETPAVFRPMPLHVRDAGTVSAYPVEGLWGLDGVGRADGLGVNVLLGSRGEDSVRLRGVSSAARARSSPDRWWSG